MQNEFLPEETPQYRTPAPILQQTKTANETETAAENALLTAEQTRLLRQLKLAHKRRVAEVAFSYSALGVSVVLVYWLSQRLIPQIYYTEASIGVAFVFLLGVMRIGLDVSRKPLPTARSIRQLQGEGAVGPLLDMLRTAKYANDEEAIYAALTRCLPRIKSGSVLSLTERQRKQLLNSLQANARPDRMDNSAPNFCIATLKALEQIGDASAVPMVEKIAAREAYTPNRIRVRDAAIDCLPLLKIRAGLAAESKTLLRASASEQTGRDTLLRPASGGKDVKPEELLRPSDGGE